MVHASHGIGRYQGLLNIDLGEGPSEFLHLQYADQATLYVPVSQLHLISRYTGVSAEEAPLHRQPWLHDLPKSPACYPLRCAMCGAESACNSRCADGVAGVRIAS